MEFIRSKARILLIAIHELENGKRIMKVRIVKLVVWEDVPLVMISDPELGVEEDQTLNQSLMKDQGPNQLNGP